MIFGGEDVRVKDDLRAVGKGARRLRFEVIGDRFAERDDPVVLVDDVVRGGDAEVRVDDGDGKVRPPGFIDGADAQVFVFGAVGMG